MLEMTLTPDMPGGHEDGDAEFPVLGVFAIQEILEGARILFLFATWGIRWTFREGDPSAL